MVNKELLMAVSGGLPPTLVVRADRETSGRLWYTLTTGESIRIDSSSSEDVYHERLISEIDINSGIHFTWFEEDTKVTTVNTSRDSPAKLTTLSTSHPKIERAPSLNSDQVYIQDPTKDAFIIFEFAGSYGAVVS